MKEAFANCSEQQYYIKTTVRTRKHLAFSRNLFPSESKGFFMNTHMKGTGFISDSGFT